MHFSLFVNGQNVNYSNNYNIQFTDMFAEKILVAFAKATHIFFFSKSINVYSILNDLSFNDTDES